MIDPNPNEKPTIEQLTKRIQEMKSDQDLLQSRVIYLAEELDELRAILYRAGNTISLVARKKTEKSQ